MRFSDADADAADAADAAADRADDDNDHGDDDDDDAIPSKPFAAWRSCSFAAALVTGISTASGSSTGATSGLWCEPVRG